LRRNAAAASTANVTLLVLLAACSGAPADETEPASVTADLATVDVRDFDVTVTTFGTVSARPGSMARVAAPGESFVTKIYVGPGDQVAAGAALVDLDKSVWSEQALEAEAALSTAQEAEARARRLVDGGILPRAQLEAATADLARARAVVADTHRTLERATLRSPISGVVTAVSAAVSQPVAANDVLVEVVDNTGLEAVVQLAPADAARIMPGAVVAVRGGLDPSAPTLAEGTVKGVSSAVDPTTGTVSVRCVLTSVGAALRPGQTVSARITVERRASAVVIPRTALVPVTQGTIVFVVDSESVAHSTPVQVGGQTTDSVQVLSGLSGGERVVTGGAYGVVDGSHVQPAGAP
jgi:membrane fusion protein, multidrug efflux system